MINPISETGVKIVDKKHFCALCGAYLGKPESIRYVGHAEGAYTLYYMYECMKCGKLIIYEREKKEREQDETD